MNGTTGTSAVSLRVQRQIAKVRPERLDGRDVRRGYLRTVRELTADPVLLARLDRLEAELEAEGLS